MFYEILKLLEDLKAMHEMSEAMIIVNGYMIRIKRFKTTIKIEVTEVNEE